MTASDLTGLALFGGFGLWWLAFPQSVIRFYTWFHRKKVRMPKPIGVRIAGAAWLILVASVWIFGRRQS